MPNPTTYSEARSAASAPVARALFSALETAFSQNEGGFSVAKALEGLAREVVRVADYGSPELDAWRNVMRYAGWVARGVRFEEFDLPENYDLLSDAVDAL